MRPSQSGTLGLTQAYERMLLNDQRVREASAERAAARDAGNIVHAALQPQASINYLRNCTSQIEYYDSTTAGQQSVDHRYFGRRARLTIEQTLFDYSAISAYRMGKTQAEYAEVRCRLQLQQQAVALIDAYLNALLARDSLDLARHQLRACQNMLRGNERMMAQGEGARIDISGNPQLGERHAVGAGELRERLGGSVARIDRAAGAPGSRRRAAGHRSAGHAWPAARRRAGAAAGRFPRAESGGSGRAPGSALQRPHGGAREGPVRPRVLLYAAQESIVSDTVNNRGRDYKTNTIGQQVTIPLFCGGPATTARAMPTTGWNRRATNSNTPPTPPSPPSPRWNSTTACSVPVPSAYAPCSRT